VPGAAQPKLNVRKTLDTTKSWHGLARAIRRGLANMRIQAYLTAAVVNLKRLPAALFALTVGYWLELRRSASKHRRQTAGDAAPRTREPGQPASG
jgi:hypothetical protein